MLLTVKLRHLLEIAFVAVFFFIELCCSQCYMIAFLIQSSAAKPRWTLVPTRREQAKWDRANKAATGGSVS